MAINNQNNPQADRVRIRDAATLLLVRDGDDGAQTLMLRRHGKAVFGPGYHVFPGGAVDAADADPGLQARCRGLDDAAASRALGCDTGGLAFWVAALRECFEEAGVLVAEDAAGAPLPVHDPAWRPRLAAAQHRLNSGEQSFAELCADWDLYLPLARVHYYSHWITPQGPPRRFSTRFFAVAAPAGASVNVDAAEVTDGAWFSGRQALARHQRGEMPMMPPTAAQLRLLRAAPDSEAFMATVRSIEHVPTVAPHMQRGDDGRVRLITGEQDASG